MYRFIGKKKEATRSLSQEDIFFSQTRCNSMPQIPALHVSIEVKGHIRVNRCCLDLWRNKSTYICVGRFDYHCGGEHLQDIRWWDFWCLWNKSKVLKKNKGWHKTTNLKLRILKKDFIDALTNWRLTCTMWKHHIAIADLTTHDKVWQNNTFII